MAMEDELNAMLELGPVTEEGENHAEDSAEENIVEDPNVEEETEDEGEVVEDEEPEGDVDESEEDADDFTGGDPRESDEDDDDVTTEEVEDEVEEEEEDPVEGDEVAALKAQLAGMQELMQQTLMGGMVPGAQNAQPNQPVTQETATTAETAEIDPEKLLEGVDFEQVFVDPQAFAGVLLNVVKAAQTGASQQATQAVQAATRQQQQKKAVDSFWKQNSDLTNFRTQLAAITQNIGNTHPNLKSTEEILEAAGTTVRTLYGLKPKAKSQKKITSKGKGKAGVKRSLKKPAKARNQSSSRRKKVVKNKKSTGMQAEIDAMLNIEY